MARTEDLEAHSAPRPRQALRRCAPPEECGEQHGEILGWDAGRSAAGRRAAAHGRGVLLRSPQDSWGAPWVGGAAAGKRVPAPVSAAARLQGAPCAALRPRDTPPFLQRAGCGPRESGTQGGAAAVTSSALPAWRTPVTWPCPVSRGGDRGGGAARSWAPAVVTSAPFNLVPELASLGLMVPVSLSPRSRGSFI